MVLKKVVPSEQGCDEDPVVFIRRDLYPTRTGTDFSATKKNDSRILEFRSKIILHTPNTFPYITKVLF